MINPVASILSEWAGSYFTRCFSSAEEEARVSIFSGFLTSVAEEHASL
jgi:hypothetical protein